MRRVGIRGIDDYPVPVVCGHCALVCGPTLEETALRYRMLTDSGLVVPGPGGRMTRVDSYEEAVRLKERYPLEAPPGRILKDVASTFWLWHRYYFGFEPGTACRAWRYRMKLREATRKTHAAGAL